ncbi:MAG: lipid-A-disaccharide synthase [Bdellovibrio sp.]|nr:MAG: lipid-A-disaccharide synthase [Bdellovibrio sp.]
MKVQVLIVAAEASSGLFAQRLLEYWQAQGKDLQAFGVGTEAMEKIGFDRLGKSEDMAVVGAAEILEHFSHLKAVFNRLVEEAARRQPRLAIVMDYPEFNLMLAKKLDQLGIPVVYYVSPQVWAWRRGRVQTIKKYCRKVLLLFPFEIPFYESKGVPYEFVGHPILDELSQEYFDEASVRLHRRRYGIADDERVVGLMPGSRKGEIRQHLQIQLAVARQLVAKDGKIRILLMVAPSLGTEFIQSQLGEINFPLVLIKDEPFAMISLADFVLVASGTATLMVGLLEKPMVIMYKMKVLTGWFARLVVRGVRFFGIVNLILGREVVPERWQSGANPRELSDLMWRYFDDPLHAVTIRQELRQLKTRLGEKGATARVAKVLEEFLR